MAMFDPNIFDPNIFETGMGGGPGGVGGVAADGEPIRRRVGEDHVLSIQVRRPVFDQGVISTKIRRAISESLMVDASVRRPVRESVKLTGNVYEKTSMHDLFHDLRDLLLLRQLDKLTE